ncbi:MAG: PEP-CTERM sorting domain-containing protein [Phycisphaeraceae bacterium]
MTSVNNVRFDQPTSFQAGGIMKRSIYTIVTLTALACAGQAQAADWIGTGTAGSIGTGIWNTASNWDTGVVPSGVNVSVDFTQTGSATLSANAPTVGTVTVTGLAPTGGSWVSRLNLSFNITMASLEITPQSGAGGFIDNGATGGVTVGSGKTLTLTGNGDVLKINAATQTEANQVASRGIINFTGTNLTFGTGFSGTVTQFIISSSTPNIVTFSGNSAAIDFGGYDLRMIAGNNSNNALNVKGGQTWTNTPKIMFSGPISLVNLNATPITMQNTQLHWIVSVENATITPLVAAGTYKALLFEHNRAASIANLKLSGDVTLAGTVDNGLTVRTTTGANGSTINKLDLNGSLLHVSSATATPIIGDVGQAGLSELNLNGAGAEMRTANTLTINAKGYVIGAGTVTVNGGRFANNSTQNGSMNLTAATIALGNAATGVDWNTGSIDVGAGLDSSSFIPVNFATGNLSLGTGTYTLGGGDLHDILVNGVLSIAGGGVLNLGNWTTVGNTLGGEVQTLAFNDFAQVSAVQSLISANQITASGLGAGMTLGIVNGSDNDSFYIGVVAIPEPASLALMGLGGLLMFGHRRRRQSRAA